jgi:tight adherence protein B
VENSEQQASWAGKAKGVAMFAVRNPLITAAGIMLVLFFSWFFYRSLFAVLILAPLMIPFCRRMGIMKQEKKKEELTQQFKEALGSLITAQRAGYSAENSFRETYREMEMLYGSTSAICRELLIVVRGMDAGISIEILMTEFGERSDIADIREFAATFSIARKSGGNMVEIMSRTVSLLQDRMDVESEINVLVSAKKMEQKIMDVVPFAIVLYIGATSEDFFAPLYHNVTGIVVMSVCLAIYLAAYALSEKIVSINI